MFAKTIRYLLHELLVFVITSGCGLSSLTLEQRTKDNLIFENLRWLWTPCTEFFYTLPKVASHLDYQNSIIKKFRVPFLKYKRLKLKLRVFLPGHSVAMVTYYVTKIIPTCSPMIGHQNLCLWKCWKLFWATLSLRCLKTVSSTFQDVDFDESLLSLFVSWCYDHAIKTKTAQSLVNTLVLFFWHNRLP